MKKICVVLCLLWMGFIFYMSSNSGEISHQESTKVVNFVENAKENLPSNADKNTINEKKLDTSKLDFFVRKNAHAFMYMVLAILVGTSFFSYNKRGIDAVVYILFICLFYAVTDEFHQSFVSGRTSLVSDILIDFAGSLIGLVFFYLIYYKICARFLIRRE